MVSNIQMKWWNYIITNSRIMYTKSINAFLCIGSMLLAVKPPSCSVKDFTIFLVVMLY